MLTVITGRSRRLWPQVLREIGEAHAAGGSRLLLITPDQYTLQAELELVDSLRLPGLLDIEVLSPARLLNRVFALAGSPRRVRIDSRGKAMVLQDVLRQSQDALQYYGEATDRRGFADRLSTHIADFKRAGKRPEEIAAAAGGFPTGDALGTKLADMALLYDLYERRLEGAFIDGEDAQEAMLKRLPDSGLVCGARVWVYGFDLIPPQFMRLVALMAREAVAVRLALTWERGDAPDGAIFTPARDTLARLARYLDTQRVEWTQEFNHDELASTPEIRFLERTLYASGDREYDGPVTSIRLSVAATPYDEAMRAAAALLRHARAGMALERISVVVGDVEAYAGAIETAFGRSGIPYHLARKRPALAHPLLRSWLAALRCATLRWRLEDALDWLKGGFCGLTVDEAERLENHAIENGLREGKWRREITTDTELEAIRRRFVDPLAALQERLRAARDNTASLAAAYGLLEDVDAYGTLEVWQRTLTARGRLAEAAECAQAWRLALETLDQLHALLHGSRMRMRDLARVVEGGLAAAELGAVPASPGMVQVGQLGHVKLGGECRVLFLLGMQDGVMTSDAPSLLSDREAQRAAEALGADAAFGMRGDALAELAQINLLDTLSAPTERLYISHAAAGAGGEAQRPAAVLGRLRRAFPGLAEGGSAISRAAPLHAPGAALDGMGPVLRAAAGDGALADTQAQAYGWLIHAPRTRAQAEGVLRALETPLPVERLGPRATGALYAHSRTSITRLETYANCPFKHYAAYGLRPAPRKAFEVERRDTGTFYHRAMEGYTKAAAALPEWPQVSRARSDEMMDAVLEPLRMEWESGPLGEDEMLRATGEAFCRVARRAAWTYAGQMRQGGFRTRVVEARFGPGEALPPIGLMLPDGSIASIEGRIDRIDFYEEDGARWLRVVDYKSGGTQLEPAKVYGGLQLQLLLYLMAALAAFPGIEAGGAFYSRMDDPLVTTDSRDVEEIERLLAKALRLRGIALSDVRVVRAQGGDINKDGTPRKSTELASADELGALMRHAYALAAGMAGGIAAGDIAARPAQLETWRACQWCDYAGVCGFDPALPGHEPRRLEKLTREAVMERLDAEEA